MYSVEIFSDVDYVLNHLNYLVVRLGKNLFGYYYFEIGCVRVMFIVLVFKSSIGSVNFLYECVGVNVD